MNNDREPIRRRTVPEPHIKVVKRSNEEAEDWRRQSRHSGIPFAEASVRRTSLTLEVKESGAVYTIPLKDPDSIANMQKGTTFAARARAAELNSARAAAAAKEAMVGGGEDEVPELAPMSLGSLKFTRRNAQKSSRGSKSQDQSVNLSDLAPSSPPPNVESSHFIHRSTSGHKPNSSAHQEQNTIVTPSLSGLGGKPNRHASLGGPTVELNQQAIRQKVREVSAKQQSINDNNQDETYRQGIYCSTSSSPFSSQESKATQTAGSHKSDLNTQYIREVQRQSEKSSQASTSIFHESHYLLDADECGNSRPQTHMFSNSNSNEHTALVQSFSDGTHVPSQYNADSPDSSSFYFSRVGANPYFYPDQSGLRSPNPGTFSTANEPLPHKKQIPDFGPLLTNKSVDGKDDIPEVTNVSTHPGSLGKSSPQHDYDSHRQVALRSSSGNLIMAENSALNTHMGSRRAPNSYLTPQDPEESQESQTTVARLVTNPQASNDTHTTLQQQRRPQLHQSGGIENQSSYGQQSQSGDNQQSHSGHYEVRDQSTYDQTGNQSTIAQSRSKAMDKFLDLDHSLGSSSMMHSWTRTHDDPFTDTTRSSSTVTPATNHSAASAHLGGTNLTSFPPVMNSSFIPRPSNPDFFPRTLSKVPLPAVKGTDRDQHFKQTNLQLHGLHKSLSQDDGRFNLSRTSTTDFAYGQKDSHTKHEKSLHQYSGSRDTSFQSHSSTAIAGKSSNLRDPMPYTGFSASASKKEQLLGSLNKTIDEAKAKGGLSASNRSVLFDPVASAARAGKQHSASNAQTSDILTSAVSRNPMFAEVPAFDDRILRSTQPMLDFEPNILKDSEPLPPSAHQQQSEKTIPSSSHGGYSLHGHPHGYMGAAPRYPPGLSQSTDPFPNAPVTTLDGFWDESLAMNTGNSATEDHLRAFDYKSVTRAEEQMHAPEFDGNAWINEQKRLLLPKIPLTNEQLDEAAKAWLITAETNQGKSVKSILLRSEDLVPLPSGTQYWQESRQGQKSRHSLHLRTALPSYQAPIGSERSPSTTMYHEPTTFGSNLKYNTHSYAGVNPAPSAMTDKDVRKRAAIDLIAPVIANLSSYRAGEDPGPLQRYSQPPAWCIDNSEAGRKSFFNDNWGDVPKRVGRDPRYQQTMHEGRSTYFEDPNPSGRRERETLPGYKPTPGWGMIRK